MRRDRLVTPLVLAALASAVLAPAPAVGQGDQTVPVVVDADTCLRLVEAPGTTSAPGVAYEPGVDARGRPVVLAEGPGGDGTDWLPDPVTIDLAVPLAKKLGIGDGATNYEAEARLGTLTLRDDGRVFLGDRLVAGGDLADLREACRRLDVIDRAARTRKPAVR